MIDQRKMTLTDQIIAKIAQTVRVNSYESSDMSLSSGIAGHAIFYHALTKRNQGMFASEQLEINIQKLYRHFSSLDLLDLRLFSGFPGSALALEHIARCDHGSTKQVSTINDDVDEVIDHFLKIPWTGHYDLVSGLTGLGVYALFRTKKAAQQSIFKRVYSILMDCSEMTKIGRRWKTSPEYFGLESCRSLWPDGNYNLGLAHGNPGVIALLTRASKLGLKLPGLEEALRSASEWVLAQDYGDCNGHYGYVVGDNKVSRTAWCYGEPSIALSIIRAGKLLKNPRLVERGITIARDCSLRRVESTLVYDHGLCHGSAGLGLIYGKIFRECGNIEFSKSSKFWQKRVFDACMQADLSGIKTHVGDGSFRLECGVLTGISGVGLALIEFSGGAPAGWSDWLLI